MAHFPSSAYNSTTGQENPFSLSPEFPDPEPVDTCYWCHGIFFAHELEKGLCLECRRKMKEEYGDGTN